MEKIKRAILVPIPMSICNFRCHYCYLAQREECFQNIQPKFEYSPEHVAKALSPERLGGLAFMNFCADGETLLTKDLDKYIYELVKEGHYVEIVTNLTVTSALEKILSWDAELLEKIEFKCSFHYLELRKRNLLETFADNVKKIWEAGASANIEITPNDELIPFIEEVKEFSLANFGALPHLTIARNDNTKRIDYLTKLPISDYDKIWSQFDSEFWRFKKEIFKVKRNEFCYAGDWMLVVNLATGFTRQCYLSNYNFNIFESIDKPIPFRAIGKCNEPHCYNGHALLTFGCIPNITKVRYGDIRNRIKNDGTTWLQPGLYEFFNSTLGENNEEYPQLKKALIKTQSNVQYIYGISGKIVRKGFAKISRIRRGKE
ncbi:radical SAM protein [Clostridium sp. SHJSY1]|uniref:radical SAM protein n=1 Tax=Clostridium sp. SHJSY1 TaxID=2942483 RepID=UPI002874429F|nr:radical SAM protein [Clostridium sp. SHJSY1]MDS0526540.1 radical SAM protein [Clostridium sp. SHJSY1]